MILYMYIYICIYIYIIIMKLVYTESRANSTLLEWEVRGSKELGKASHRKAVSLASPDCDGLSRGFVGKSRGA